MNLRNLGIALSATVAIGLATAAPASAQHHWHGGGFGPGFVGGLAVGAAVGSAPYYGYGYGYGPGPYAYAGDCYIRRHVVINRFGARVVRRVRVCD